VAEVMGEEVDIGGIHRLQRSFVGWMTEIMHFSIASALNDCLQ